MALHKTKELSPALKAELEEYIKINHPDPDTLVDSTDKWLWLYRGLKVERFKAYKEGFIAANNALDASTRMTVKNIDKQLDKL